MDSPFTRRALYPPAEPRLSGRLSVGDGHQLHWEECGRPDGIPVVVLHGGPGGGISPAMRRFFDPGRWRVVLFDQRGAGRSTPHAGLEANTTPHLISDIERLRTRLGIEAWAVFGGSWGSTLALAYAQAFPDRVRGLVLRGVFLCTRSEIDWFYRGGAGEILPDAWDRFLAPLQPEQRADPVASYYERLAVDDFEARRPFCRTWAEWESAALTRSLAGRRSLPRLTEPHAADALARIECHYMMHEGFFERPLLDEVAALAGLPCAIVQGRLDLVTPPRAAWRLAQAWPGAQLTIVENAGHAAVEPGMVDQLVRATDALAARLG